MATQKKGKYNLKLNSRFNGPDVKIFFIKGRRSVRVKDIIANPVPYLRNHNVRFLFENTQEELDAIKKLDPHKVAKGKIKVNIE